MSTNHFFSRFRQWIVRDFPLCQLHDFAQSGLLRIRPKVYHHGIRNAVDHDPALPGGVKLLLFVRSIVHIFT